MFVIAHSLWVFKRRKYANNVSDSNKPIRFEDFVIILTVHLIKSYLTAILQAGVSHKIRSIIKDAAQALGKLQTTSIVSLTHRGWLS